MSELIKGNYESKKIVIDEDDIEKKDSLEDEFEKAALNRLGGSIAYVSRKKVMWSAEDKGDIEKIDPSEDQKAIDKIFKK
jgi:hypothetical protein